LFGLRCRFLHACTSSSSSGAAPAFKFVLTFIALLLSDLLKAVDMPIVNALNSVATDCVESIALNGDGDWALHVGNLPSHFYVPLPTIQSDSVGEGNG